MTGSGDDPRDAECPDSKENQGDPREEEKEETKQRQMWKMHRQQRQKKEKRRFLQEKNAKAEEQEAAL